MDDRTSDATGGGEKAPQALPVPRIGADGKPVYDQKFFLALARLGKDVWNRWRAEHPAEWGSSHIAVSFAGVDFREPDNSGINFSGFVFGNSANFSGCQFGDRANFSYAIFRDHADLSGATFGEFADFTHTKFGNAANLSCATFWRRANLSGTTFELVPNLSGTNFGHSADFSGAYFWGNADFSGATFGPFANFSGVMFFDGPNLSGTTLGYATKFSSAKFHDYVDMRALSRDTWKNLRSSFIENSQFTKSWSQERRERFLTIEDELGLSEEAGADSFLALDFSDAHFESVADFSGRMFRGHAKFARTRFDQPPNFDNCKGTGQLDFYNARMGFGSNVTPFRWFPIRVRYTNVRVRGWTMDGDIALRLRRVRKLAEETKNHDLERDLYIEERKAERGILLGRCAIDLWRALNQNPIRASEFPHAYVRALTGSINYLRAALTGILRIFAHTAWIAVMSVYWLLADYGRSFARPLLALVLSVFLFQALYPMAVPRPGAAGEADFNRALSAFTVAHAVPFVGALTLDKEVQATLLCGARPTDPAMAQQQNVPVCASVPLPSLGFQLLVLGQSIFSALCVFFIALALRNFFKLR